MIGIQKGLSVATLFAVVGSALAASPTPTYVANEILVKFKPTSASLRPLVHQYIGSNVEREIPQIGVQVVELRRGTSVDAALRYYRSLSSVQYAEPNYIQKKTFVPNDPRYNEQYSHLRVNAPKAWDLSLGAPSVKVAIIDTGIDYNHPDLAGKVIKGKDVVNDDDDPMDDEGHGTHCAGIAAATSNNGIGIAGIGFNVTLIGVKVLDANGSGNTGFSAAGIIDAADRGADVISLSLGGYGTTQASQDAVNYAWSKGAVVVAAAGNDNTSTRFYPAALDNVISVGASDVSDARANFSNYGADWVSVAAPGVDILSTLPNNTYGLASGTSMACPLVSGLVGLMKSYGGADVTNAELRSALESSTDFIGTWINKGRVNAFRAVNSIVVPLVVDSPAKTLAIYSESNFTQGALLSGTVSNLAAMDNKSVSVTSVTQPGVARISSIHSVLTIDQNPARIISGNLQVAAKSVSGVTIQVFLKNSSGKFDLVKSLPATSNYQTINFAPEDWSKYLVNKQVTVVVRGYVSLTKSPVSHTLSADMINMHLLVNPRP